VQTRSDADARQRLRLDELLANRLEHGHGLEGPLHAPLALVRQGDVFHVASDLRGCFSCHKFLLLRDRFGDLRSFP